MPSSHPDQLNEVVQIAELVNPSSILDIGIGFGKYGFLLREFIDVVKYGDVVKWHVRIDGIEGEPTYVDDLQRKIYNDIYIGDILSVLNSICFHYDFAILIDVIEHFDRNCGLSVIGAAFDKSDFLLITTPWDIGDPNIKHENPLLDHKYQWRKRDFVQFGCCEFIYNNSSLIVLIGRDRAAVRYVAKKMRRRPYKKIYDFVRRQVGLKRN